MSQSIGFHIAKVGRLELIAPIGAAIEWSTNPSTVVITASRNKHYIDFLAEHLNAISRDVKSSKWMT